MGHADAPQAPPSADTSQVPEGTDLIEWYYERGCSDGLPLVPPTPEKIAAAVAALGGEPGRLGRDRRAGEREEPADGARPGEREGDRERGGGEREPPAHRP